MQVRFILAFYARPGAEVVGLKVREADGERFVALDFLPRELTGTLGNAVAEGRHFTKVVILANGSDNFPREGIYDYWERIGFYATVEISGKWYLRLEAISFDVADANYGRIRNHVVAPTRDFTANPATPPEQPTPGKTLCAEELEQVQLALRKLLRLASFDESRTTILALANFFAGYKA